jgi:hypothetical protein
MVVKQKRAPGGKLAHLTPAVHQPPPPYVVHQPTPPVPPSPRQHFKFYLIEAEAPSVGRRAFIFTFLDPDDPTYVQMDNDTEGS